MNMNIKAITHDGPFHADDALAAAILRIVYPDIEFIRTRNPKDLEGLDVGVIVFDVGMSYDPNNNYYDHHQGAGARPNGVPYAAAGLVWQHWGRQLCHETEVWAEVDRSLIQPVDAHDNGYPLMEFVHETKPLTISGIVGLFNPSWQEADQDFDAGFFAAVELMQAILRRAIVMAEGRVAARQTVAAALEARSDPRIVVLPRFVPWQELVCADPDALLVVYPAVNGQWNVQTVPVEVGSQKSRMQLPAWPQTAAELAAATGVSDAVFAHRGRFLAAATSQPGALALAELALQGNRGR